MFFSLWITPCPGALWDIVLLPVPLLAVPAVDIYSTASTFNLPQQPPVRNLTLGFLFAGGHVGSGFNVFIINTSYHSIVLKQPQGADWFKPSETAEETRLNTDLDSGVSSEDTNILLQLVFIMSSLQL